MSFVRIVDFSNIKNLYISNKLLKTPAHHYQQMQGHQEEVEARHVQCEQEFQADLAARDATLESVSCQLEESRINQLWVLFNHYRCRKMVQRVF